MKQIPHFKLNPEPQTDEAKQLPGFQYAPAEIGSRHQLGGIPTGIHETDYPKCSTCGKVMSFYGQFDSISDEFVIADCGTLAVFYCFDCIEAKVEIISG